MMCQFTFHYASTLSFLFTPEELQERNLHSTMLLLYLFAVSPKSTRIKIYIPLCFYFIGGATGTDNNNEKFTFHYASTLSGVSRLCINTPQHLHSTMLLLYLISLCRSLNLVVFTFHYASTLSKQQQSQTLIENIYIPLCFYFIENLNYQEAKDILIYIPLCFYFIIVVQQDRIPVKTIYIPLCFYFIIALLCYIVYVSAIYIPLCFYFIK